MANGLKDKINQAKEAITDIKTSLAQAITEKGVDTDVSASFSEMAENVGKIESNGGSSTYETYIGKELEIYDTIEDQDVEMEILGETRIVDGVEDSVGELVDGKYKIVVECLNDSVSFLGVPSQAEASIEEATPLLTTPVEGDSIAITFNHVGYQTNIFSNGYEFKVYFYYDIPTDANLTLSKTTSYGKQFLSDIPLRYQMINLRYKDGALERVVTNVVYSEVTTINYSYSSFYEANDVEYGYSFLGDSIPDDFPGYPSTTAGRITQLLLDEPLRSLEDNSVRDRVWFDKTEGVVKLTRKVEIGTDGVVALLETPVTTILETPSNLTLKTTPALTKITSTQQGRKPLLRGRMKVVEVEEPTPPPAQRFIYGVSVDETNSNPETAVTYIEDAIGVEVATPTGYGGWADKYPFNQIKPCGFKDGQVVKYINPNDFSKYEDDTDVTDDVDVMIEFPKLWWNFTTTDTGYELRISNEQVDENYVCPAHTVGTEERDKIYVGAFMGCNEGGKLRSKSGVSPTVSQTIGTFRTQAQANGEGYQQYNYTSMLMLQILYLIMYKNRDSQTALGYGYANGNSAKINTGETSSKGMIFGETTGKQQMKFLGIEDFWGNVYSWVDGFYSSSNRTMMISDNSVFNNNGSGYIDNGIGASANTGGYTGKVQGGNYSGFVIKDTSGSTTTKYCNWGKLDGGCPPVVGGNWNGDLYAGAFRFACYYSASNSYSIISSRLVHLG